MTLPTVRDESTLTDLDGYRVIYGRASDALDQTVDVPNAGLTSYVVANLSQGTWYFAVVAVNRAGIESDISNVASKVIN